MVRVVQMVHGGERLARADAAVIGRDHAVEQHAESGGAQQSGAERREQAVLEHAFTRLQWESVSNCFLFMTSL